MEDRFVITGINRVIMVGKEEYPEKISSFNSDLKWNELIFHFSGQTRVYFGDQVLETKPNTVRFLPEGSWGRYEVVRSEVGECIDVCFLADRPIAPQAFVIDDKQNEKHGILFKKLFAAWVGKNDGYYFETISLLYKIFAELQNKIYVSGEHWLKIKPAVSEIHDNFLQKTLSVDKLAEICGIGESYFERLFKEKFGVSPKKYIIQLKINHACELLRLERYSVKQISELCNFSDVYFFSRQFKEYIGITPTQFIKKYRSSK